MLEPVTMIKVLCDAKRLQTIAITCRCGRRWTEKIPAELHESRLIAVFDCPACQRQFWLRDKVLLPIPLQGDSSDGQQTNSKESDLSVN